MNSLALFNSLFESSLVVNIEALELLLDVSSIHLASFEDQVGNTAPSLEDALDVALDVTLDVALDAALALDVPLSKGR